MPSRKLTGGSHSRAWLPSDCGDTNIPAGFGNPQLPGRRACAQSASPGSASWAHPASYSLLSPRWSEAWCSGLGVSAACPGQLTEAAKEQEAMCRRYRQPCRGGRKSIFIGLAFLLTELFPNDIYLTVFDSSYEHVSGKQDLYSLRPQLPVSS